MSLVDKIRKAREQIIEAGGFSFTIRRPTDVEMLDLQGTVSISHLFRFIVGWSGVKEIDLIPGGGPDPVPFSADVCAEWLADRPDLLGPLVSSVTESYARHTEALESAAKN